MDDLERDLGDEYGWKQIHGDVFRPAEQRMLFCSLIGTGAQVSVQFDLFWSKLINLLDMCNCGRSCFISYYGPFIY